jgi:hypothetical protein
MKAKILASVFLAVLLAMAASPAYADVLPGDANEDSVVDITDVTAVERIIVELDAPTPGADANQDGNINSLDITKTELIIAELD